MSDALHSHLQRINNWAVPSSYLTISDFFNNSAAGRQYNETKCIDQLSQIFVQLDFRLLLIISNFNHVANLIMLLIFTLFFSQKIYRKQMRSMDFYKDAVVAADEQKDCAVQYPDCTYTLVDKVGKWATN